MHIRLNGTLCKARPTWGGNERSCCTQSPNLLVLCRNLLHFIFPALKLPAQGVLGTLQSFFKPLLDHAVGYLQQCLKSAQGRERGSVEVSLTGISLSFNKSSINIFISFIIYLLMSLEVQGSADWKIPAYIMISSLPHLMANPFLFRVPNALTAASVSLCTAPDMYTNLKDFP